MTTRMAHDGLPLAMHPGQQPVWADDPILDVTLSERAKHVLGFALLVVVVVALILAPLAVGALFGMSGQP